MSFIESMRTEYIISTNYNGIRTENGAIGFKTCGDKLVDFNFKTSSFRNVGEEEIKAQFVRVFNEDPQLAIVWLFFARDVRGGMGERRLFRVCLGAALEACKYILNGDVIEQLCELIMEYGRADDLYTLNKVGFGLYMAHFMAHRLEKDVVAMSKGGPVSLLAKWMKSEKASSEETRRLAKESMRLMGWSPARYRKTLSALRKYIDVVEVKMSASEWDKIKYEAVPSKAGMNYAKAFLRHDGERYDAFIESVNKGEAKINAGALFPHEIVNKYGLNYSRWSGIHGEFNPTLEAMWKNLPSIDGFENTLVVADGSGSMTCQIDKNSKTTALDVANALAIYFSERAKGPFKNKYITFSEHPQFVSFEEDATLFRKLSIALEHDEVANTNIERVFDLILDTAMRTGAKQEELPKNILVISDMEFDQGVEGNVDEALFDQLKKRFEGLGYKMPRLVFWNTNSRTCAIPVVQNDLGVALVSGFSQNIASMVMSEELDPKKCLYRVLCSDRYEAARAFAKTIENELHIFTKG